MENEKKKESENFTVWISRFYLRTLPQAWVELTDNSPFKGSRLVATGRHRARQGREVARYEFQVEPTVAAFTAIPGYRLVGFGKREWSDDKFYIYTIGGGNDVDWQWRKSVFDALDPTRCDVCGVRHERKRLFVFKKENENVEMVVGGSCARKAFPVNLETEIKKAFSFVEEIQKQFDGEGGGGGRREAAAWQLASAIAVGEVLCRVGGFVSARQAETSNRVSTGSSLRALLTAHSASEVAEANTFWARYGEEISRRAKQLSDTSCAEYVKHFEKLLAERWSDFVQNCLTLLRSPNAHFQNLGYVAYISSLRGLVNGAPKATAEKTTGYRAETGKMIDMGWFKVVSVKERQGYRGDTEYGFTCVNEQNQKLWFKLQWNSEARKLWKNTTGVTEAKIRGKLAETKDEISFAKNVKFLEVR